jgi:hypothetical protein
MIAVEIYSYINQRDTLCFKRAMEETKKKKPYKKSMKQKVGSLKK